MRKYTRINVTEPEFAFFTADPHFFHEGIIGHCNRPFRDADEMSEALIRNWNAIVHPNGSVFVLGDMFWKKGDIDKCQKIMDRLNGKKWLVAGNHDLWERDQYLEMGFEDARDYLELNIDHQVIVCCHYPLLEWNAFITVTGICTAMFTGADRISHSVSWMWEWTPMAIRRFPGGMS